MLMDSVNGRFGFVSAGGWRSHRRHSSAPVIDAELLNEEANEIDPDDADLNTQIVLVIGVYVITQPPRDVWLAALAVPVKAAGPPQPRPVQVSGAGGSPGLARMEAGLDLECDQNVVDNREDVEILPTHRTRHLRVPERHNRAAELGLDPDRCRLLAEPADLSIGSAVKMHVEDQFMPIRGKIVAIAKSSRLNVRAVDDGDVQERREIAVVGVLREDDQHCASCSDCPVLQGAVTLAGG
ncbi:hypothetical protein [Nocardioides pinisoli]|uniref:Uncharacterized protein n=1 Tax=Nocardioides pinisoli TaxID=2950279 RepID=A0ABT1L0F0_9ACTN|nr:hypothetical protein [Nocardioides pinisoli]MCP3423499.1 hypothetical protein [Nocardioides pinisoli]